MKNIPYTLSLLTSSTQCDLDQIRTVFCSGERASEPVLDSVEVYLLRENDLDALEVPGRNDPMKSMAYLIGQYKEDEIEQLALAIKKKAGRIKISSLASYFPEIVSADLERREEAVRALVNAVRIADRLGVTRVEMVGGRHDEECTRYYQNGDDEDHNCTMVFSFYDYVRSESEQKPFSTMKDNRPAKVDWLIGGLYEVHKRLSDCKLQHPVQLLLELEPGPLFVLSRRHRLKYVMKQTSDLRTPGHNSPFIGYNCDIGHLLVMTNKAGIHPAKMWSDIFDGVSEPRERVGNFHISSHPYYRIHLDHPPTVNPDFAVPEVAERDRLDNWGVPGCFIPWLSCVLCVSEKNVRYPVNLSLELEAVARDEPVIEGLKSLRIAMNRIRRLREEEPRWVMCGCEECPLNIP